MDRRNKKKLGNVCHQSFAVEDEEDGADDINYAMQQPSSNPPPLPNSGPPISDEDEEDRIQQRSNDRNSLGGSSYDKVGTLIYIIFRLIRFHILFRTSKQNVINISNQNM